MDTCKSFLIFPNQLFKTLTHIPTNTQIYLVEDPLFFFESKKRPFKIHKLKLAFHRASCKIYFDNWLKPKYPNAKYIDFNQTFSPSSPVGFCDPYDTPLVEKYPKAIIFPTPAFILNEVDYKQLPATARNVTIYAATRTKIKMFQNMTNMDSMNRERLNPTTTKIPKIYTPPQVSATTYIKEAQSYIEKHFKSHVGSSEKLPQLAITHAQAKDALKHFCKTHFKHYGQYQDAVVENESYLFHSNISYLINSGLLTPLEVVKYIGKNTRGNPANSVEGFVRQILGWREYMGYIYKQDYKNLQNIFKPTSRKLSTTWYTAKTGISPIDTEIEKALKHAYAHHIIRLMYFLNVFKLTNTSPYLIYKWFMEVIALDAYEWVMYTNIGAMGYYTKRHYMQKPYLSSSNYIRKLSNYKPGDWCAKWDTLFHTYLKTRKAKGLLKDGEAIYLRNIKR